MTIVEGAGAQGLKLLSSKRASTQAPVSKQALKQRLKLASGQAMQAWRIVGEQAFLHDPRSELRFIKFPVTSIVDPD